jgi:hypothetical protein
MFIHEIVCVAQYRHMATSLFKLFYGLIRLACGMLKIRMPKEVPKDFGIGLTNLI